MSHNLHVFHLRAQDPEDAASIVENFIFDWGGTDNWCHVVGICDIDNVLTLIEKRDKLDEIVTFATVGKEVADDMAVTIKSQEEGTYAYAKRIVAKGVFSLQPGELNTMSYYLGCLKHYAEANTFAIAGWSTYKEFEYDEFGVTNATDPSAKDDGKEYLVTINMHS